MTYRELQTALKNLRNAGYDIQVKLNASFDTLQAEHNRLSVIASQDSIEQPHFSAADRARGRARN